MDAFAHTCARVSALIYYVSAISELNGKSKTGTQNIYIYIQRRRKNGPKADYDLTHYKWNGHKIGDNGFNIIEW